MVFSPDGAAVPGPVSAWLDARGLAADVVQNESDLMARALRGRPRLVVFDARANLDACSVVCTRMKRDSYTGIIPALFVCANGERAVTVAFDAGADEVLTERSSETPFAVCYADLDHFKEFNDRYSYYDGDRVIRILAKILHDVVKGMCGEEGFVGHIGGDDFIFIIPALIVNETCSEIVSIFDALVPFQYSEQDRRAGYFFGKDRRGQLHRVPLMTVSIGVVSNERRQFANAAQVSELATEMKSYAKTLTGSVYTIDRRQDAANGRVVRSSTARSDVPLSLGDES